MGAEQHRGSRRDTDIIILAGKDGRGEAVDIRVVVGQQRQHVGAQS